MTDITFSKALLKTAWVFFRLKLPNGQIALHRATKENVYNLLGSRRQINQNAARILYTSDEKPGWYFEDSPKYYERRLYIDFTGETYEH